MAPCMQAAARHGEDACVSVPTFFRFALRLPLDPGSGQLML